ncbi:ribosomal protein S18 [Martensiomyces pterosporus]|nr:ribosomal protein S18 [Martensiomyces pterosporus]
MLSITSKLFKPRFAAVFARTMSATPTAGAGGDSKAPASVSPQEPARASRAEQVNRIISMSTTPSPQSKTGDKAYENSSYSRVFFAKSAYHPRDLNENTAQRQLKQRAPSQAKMDPFVALDIDPTKEYKNSYLLSNFVTDMGKIRPRYKTGLSAKSQRKVAKAIKRARAFGLMPVTSRFNPMYNYKSLGRGSR